MICLFLLFASDKSGSIAGEADLILYDGKVITVDPAWNLDGRVIAENNEQPNIRFQERGSWFLSGSELPQPVQFRNSDSVQNRPIGSDSNRYF